MLQAFPRGSKFNPHALVNLLLREFLRRIGGHTFLEWKSGSRVCRTGSQAYRVVEISAEVRGPDLRAKTEHLFAEVCNKTLEPNQFECVIELTNMGDLRQCQGGNPTEMYTIQVEWNSDDAQYRVCIHDRKRCLEPDQHLPGSKRPRLGPTAAAAR